MRRFSPIQERQPPLCVIALLAGIVLFLKLSVFAHAETSELWGAHGETWDSHGRLPDFSYAGYHCGEATPPKVPAGVSVKKFGAIGDGQADDTRAFLDAIAATTNGAIEVPAGRYRITNILEFKRSGVVLRGAGPDRTILYFPKALNEVQPWQSATTTGRPTSQYSWAGGFVWLKGDYGNRPLATVAAEALRGDSTLTLSSVKDLRVGQRIEIRQRDTDANSLATELYSGDPGDTSKLLASTRASLVCTIRGIVGNRIQFDRPLRFNVKLEWRPEVVSYEPTMSESGVENLCFEFPNTPYAGHFTEPGFNAIAFSGVSDCWARNLRITNSDSGIFVGGRFCLVQGVVFESARPTDVTGSTGHHGFDFEGEDNLFTDFDFRTQFIHDLTLDHCAAGNVFTHGKGVDLCFDHHCRTPYENLFVDLDAGAGTHLWRSSGGAALGKHSGARGTFWNIRAATPQKYPPAGFGPPSINLVAVQTDQPSEKSATNRWFEAIPPGRIEPADIHAAQLAKRIGKVGK